MQDQLIPIRTLAELTGVNSATLRAWERRYGLIKPKRTHSGHRLYDSNDVAQVQKILAWLAKGIAVSQVRQLLDKEPKNSALPPISDVWEQYQQQMYRAIGAFNLKALDSIYNETLSLYPIDIITEQLLLPLLEQLAERWIADTAENRAEENFFAGFMRNKLGARFHHATLNNDGPTLICASLAGELHEFGAMLFALYLLAHGYQIIFLGSNIPIESLAYVVKRTQACAIVLTGTAKNLIIEPLTQLQQNIAKPIFIKNNRTQTADVFELITDVITLKNNFYFALKQIKEKIKPKFK